MITTTAGAWSTSIDSLLSSRAAASVSAAAGQCELGAMEPVEPTTRRLPRALHRPVEDDQHGGSDDERDGECDSEQGSHDPRDEKGERNDRER